MTTHQERQIWEDNVEDAVREVLNPALAAKFVTNAEGTSLPISTALPHVILLTTTRLCLILLWIGFQIRHLAEVYEQNQPGPNDLRR